MFLGTHMHGVAVDPKSIFKSQFPFFCTYSFMIKLLC